MEKKTDYTEYVPARIQEQIKSKNTNTVLGFLICYGTKYKNEEGWFHIGNDHMVKQTGLNVRAINRAKDILRANSLIINYNQGTANKEEGNKQCEYLLDWDRIFSDDCDHLVNDTNLLILEELRRIREGQDAYLKALKDFEEGWTKRVDKLLECLEVSTPNDHPYISERSKNISDSTDSSKVYGDNTPEGIRNDTKDQREKKKEKNKENLHTHEGTRTLAGTEPYAGTRSLTVQVEKTKKEFSSFSSSESSTDQEPNDMTREPDTHVCDVEEYDLLNADVVDYGMRLNGKRPEEQMTIKREFERWINGLEFTSAAIDFDMRGKLVRLFESFVKQYQDS